MKLVTAGSYPHICAVGVIPQLVALEIITLHGFETQTQTDGRQSRNLHVLMYLF